MEGPAGGSWIERRITREQRDLVKKLSRYSDDAGRSYKEALYAYHSRGNPDRSSHFAYGLRDVIDLLAKEGRDTGGSKQDRAESRRPGEKRRASLLVNTFDPITKQKHGQGAKYRTLAEIYKELSNIGHGKEQIGTERMDSMLIEVEGILHELARRQEEINDEVEQIISGGPSAEGAKRLMEMQTSGATQIHVLKSLTTDWLHHMADAGYFEPPEDGGHWFSHMYLTGCAISDPEKVAGIITSYDIKTLERYNSVYTILLECISNLPAGSAEKVARHMLENEWHRRFWIVEDYYIRVINNMYLNGNTILAADLLRKALSVPLTGPGGLDMPDTEYAQTHAEMLVGGILRRAGEIDLIPLLGALADVLDALIRRKGPGGGVSDVDSSMSGTRPSVESDPAWPEDMAGSLVTHARDCLSAIATRDPGRLCAAMEVIAHREHLVWRRVEMLIYQRFPDGFMDRMEDYAVRYLGQEDLDHEYRDMLVSHFSSMSAATRKKIIGMIMGRFGRDRMEGIRKEWGDKRAEGYRDGWMMRHLEAVKDCLDAEGMKEYGGLAKKYERNENPGSRSSYRIDEARPPLGLGPLEGKDADQVFEWIKGYEPGLIPPDPTLERFSEFVRKNPLESSGRAMELANSDPRVQIKILDGLEKALHEDDEVDWKETMRLVLHICRSGSGTDGLARSVCRLLMEGLERDAPGEETGPQLWEAAGRLAGIPFDREAWDEQFRKDTDSVTVSLNGIDGLSFHVIVNYALWRHGRGEKGLAREVRDLLDSYLGDPVNQTVSRNGVLGMYMPSLRGLDRVWASGMPGKIREGNTKIAFWDGYVRWNRLSTEVFSDMEAWYGGFLNGEITRGLRDGKTYRSTFDHVLLAYLHGIGRSGSMFKGFLEYAKKDPPAGLIDHCVSYIGRVIRSRQDDERFDVKGLDALWTHPAFLKRDLQGWFVGSRMGREWTIRSYARHVAERAKSRAGRLRITRPLVGELGSYAGEFPGIVADCLESMIGNAAGEIIPDGAEGVLDEVARADNSLRERCEIMRDRVLSRRS